MPPTRTHAGNISRSRNMEELYLRNNHSIFEPIHMETRRSSPRKRHGCAGHVSRTPNGVLCRDKHQRCIHQRMEGTEKGLPRRGKRENKLRGTRLYPNDTTNGVGGLKRRHGRIPRRMERSENRRQLRANPPQDTGPDKPHPTDRRRANSIPFFMPRRRKQRKHGISEK